MTTEMRNLIILLGAIVVILLLVMLFFGGKSPIMKFLGLFLEQTDDTDNSRKRGSDEPKQKSSSEPIVEMVKLVRKSDDRLRIFESNGQVRLVDEYYELEFVTRKGKKLRIECSKDAYEKIPFEKEGSLTYKRNILVKFKFYDGIIYNTME